MADKRVKIVDIQVNIQQAVTSLAQYEQAIEDAKKRQKELKKELKDGSITQQQYQSAMAVTRQEIKSNQSATNGLTKQVQNQITMVKAQEGSIKQLKAELAQATTQYQNMSRAERESSSGTKLKSHIASLKTEIASASSETVSLYKNMGSTSAAEKGLENLKGKAASLAKQFGMMATGGGLIALGKNIITTTRNFEDGMARVQAVTNATQAEFHMLEEEALKWGSTTRYTATEAANSLENLTRNGLSAEQATAALGPTLQLAQANTIGLAEAADITTNVMNGFGMKVKDLGRVNDVLSSTAAHSATNISQLAEAEKNAAPFGHSLGQNIEQVNAALGVLADVGIKGSDAGTALRMVLMGLASPTAKQQKAFQLLGVNISEETLRTDGLTKTLEKLRDSGVMKTANSAQILGDIFGRRVAPQAMALLNNIDGLKKKLDILNQSQGTTERMFNQSYSNLSNSLYGIQSAWEHVLISIGKASNNPMVTVTESIRKGILWISANLPAVGKAIMDVIAAITFTKLIASAKSAYTEMTTSAYANATASSAAVQQSQQKEQALIRETAALQAQLENNKTATVKLSAEEEKLIATQLATKKQQLAIQTAQTQKLQATESAKWQEAQALTSGNAWTRGFAAASKAVKSFGVAIGAALKSTIILGAITLIVEGITRLVAYISKLNPPLINLQSVYEKVAKDIKTQNESITKSGADAAAKQKAQLELLRAAAANANRPINERRAAINKLMSIVPGYQAQISKSGKLFENNATAITNYVKKLQKAAEAEAAYSMYVENEKKILQAKMTIEDKTNKINKVSDQLAARGYSRDAKVKTETKQYGFGEGSDTQQTSYTTNAKGETVEVRGNEKRFVSKAEKVTTKLQNDKDAANVVVKGLSTQQKYLQKKFDLQNVSVKKTGNALDEVDNSGRKTLSGGGDDEKERKKRETAAEKERKQREDRQKKENEALKLAHDSALALMEDTIEKRRTQIENQYDDEINKLKARLANEKNLTETARDAITQAIKNKEAKKEQELAKLSDESIKQDVAREQKYIDSRLSVVQKGSAEELVLKKQKIAEEKKLSMVNLESDIKKNTTDATEKRDNAKNDMDQAKGKLDSAKESGADEQAIAQAQADYNAKVEIYNNMEAELTRIVAEGVQMRADLETKARQDSAQADLAYAQQQEADRQQVFANKLAELEMEGMQQNELQQDLNTLGIDVMTQNEFDKLEVQRQAAQDKLDFLQEYQQLENESDDEYTQRLADNGMTREQVDTNVTEAKKSLASTNEQINAGEVKNEQAKQKAFQSVGTSMISMLDTLGESNSAFAKMSKIITLAQIAIDTGKALSAGIASASSLPYPANLAAIATTVATVLANVASAIATVKSAKFATGGKVTGPGTGTSDSINAQLSNGEYVMTAKATRMFEPMLAAMNAIGAGAPIAGARNYSVVQNTQDMTDSFSTAAQEIRPIVSVEEITDTQNRVSVIQNLDNV